MRKKVFLLILIIIVCAGCTNIKKYSYDDILNKLVEKPLNANTYQKGYRYYIPRGLSLKDSGSNYAIIESNDGYYYLYFDLINMVNNKEISWQNSDNNIYSRNINYDNKTGFANIVLVENNQYLIEIMYNYAKIEVMVDDESINRALINSITILNSIKYDEKVVEKLINDNSLVVKEEVFDIFKKVKGSSDYLDYIEGNSDDTTTEEIKDTDYIN